MGEFLVWIYVIHGFLLEDGEGGIEREREGEEKRERERVTNI